MIASRLSKYIWRKTLDIFYPKKCITCGKHGENICFDCASKVEKIQTLTCFGCGKLSENGKLCPKCKRGFGNSLDQILIAAKYETPIPEMISALKYDGFVEISELLGELLYEKYNKSISDADAILVPVPLHKDKEKQRGFNQSVLLSKYLSNQSGNIICPCLVRIRNTRTQVGLHRKERIRNISGAFRAIESIELSGKTVILIDDVITTGATLFECGRCLKQAGAKKVIALVVARHI